jgi:hypothetical protein
MKENIVQQESCAFALRVVKWVKYLRGEKQGFGLSKEVLDVELLLRSLM